MEVNTSIEDQLTGQLQQLWQSVLATEQAVKPEDDFFQLGGTWTTAVEFALMASKQGNYFGVEDVYEYPRFCDLAQRAVIALNSNPSMVDGTAINDTDEDPSSSFPPGSFPSEDSIWQTCEMEPQPLWHPTYQSIAPTTLLRASWALLQGKYEGAASVAFKTAGSEGPMVPFVSIWSTDEKIQEFLNRVQQSGKALGAPPPSLSTNQEIRSGLMVTTVLDAGDHDNTCEKIRATRPSLALEIHCILSADRISLVGGSWKGVMSGPALQRTLEQLQHTIQQVATCGPDDVLRSLQLISPGDRQQLLEWNRLLPEEVAACVHEQFDASVQRWADDAVIDAWDGSLSYRELDELSSRLADHLVGLGIGREKVVGMSYEKSKWAVICMLAILKAGGACLFLDPQAPRARRESLPRDAGATLLLTSPANLDSAGDRSLPSLVIDHLFIDTLPLSQSPEPRAVRRSSPSDAAFIVFSSGSTGKPKASVIEHRSVCTLARYRGQLLSQGPGTRLLQWPAYTFDVAYGEMVMVLLNGGCICIASDGDRVNNLEQAIRRFEANSIYMTPSALDMLTPENVPSLEKLTVGGEALTSTIVQKWAHRTDLKVTYGPSECTVASVGLSHVDSDTPAGTIGYGIGARTWVVDPDNKSYLAAVGTVGELWLEGPKLARGYMNAALDAGAFLNVPPFLPELDPSDKVRLYHTGDMVRYLPSGALQFLGRKDTQVEIRGQRVELDEINFYLANALPQKSQAAVLVVTPQDEARLLLVAAIHMDSHGRDKGSTHVLEAGETPEGFSDMISEVVEKLRSILPAYMVPSAFLPLSRLPKTVSGKLDYASLRACCQRLARPQLVAFWSDPAALPATTPTERLLVSAWAGVLGCEESVLGADSDFLRMGGDSLHAILLISALRKRGMRLTVQKVFENPQLARMAAAVDAFNVEDEHPVSTDSQPAEPFSMCPDTPETVRRTLEEQSGMPARLIEDAYPCSPLQAGMMALSLTEPRSYLSQNTYHTPQGGDAAQFRAAWDVMFRRSPILRTRIVLFREEMLQVVVHEDHIPWQAVNDVDSYLAADLQTPTSLGQPLVRFAYADDAVVLTIHHALSDGWHKEALLEDVDRVYRGLDPSPHLPYSSFIRHVQAMDRSAAVKFWSQRLRQAPATAFPTLPSPGYRPYADQVLQTAVTLPPRAPSSRFTLATLVRTAWGLVMARYSATTDAIFGETVTGRAMPLQGIELVEGPTIATVPVRVSFKLSQTVHSLLEAMQRDATEMIPHEQLGLQAISRVSSEARQACAFQSMLVIQNYRHRSVDDKGEAPRLVAQRHRINLSHLLTVNVTPKGSEMEFLARFDGEVLKAHQVRRLLQQTQHVLVQLWCTSAAATIRDIELLSPEDGRDIARWNDYPVEAAETSLPALIEKRAFIQPDAPAVRAWDGELTYAELLRLSANLADHLRERGVVRGQAIPVCFEKSAWTVVVMLAILRSGAMVVPLDAKHPVGRIATIVEASEAKLMVASTLQAPRFQDQSWEVLSLSPADIQALKAPADSLPTIAPSDVALIMFTSGSTGVPKGIVMDHRCLCSSIVTHSAVLRVPPRINVLQYSAYTFDHSIFEIYTTLVTGGCVCVLSDDERMNSLVESMRRFKINWVYFTPSTAKLIHVEDVPTLSTLYVGGELVPRSLIDEWAATKTVINAYGPAECSMMSSCVLTPSSPAGTIGKPQAGRTWIVDADDFDRLAPIGVAGEMIYEGPMVAKGYLHETPSSGFIRRPKWASPDSPFRFYRTGDLGRYEPDGSLVFAGRKDTQIKLRGQRVELGEVESQMQKRLPDTLLAVEVVIPGDGDGTMSLAAFLNVNGATPSADDATKKPAGLINDSPEAKRRISSLIIGLEEALLRALPEYMVPTVFLPVNALPMTTSGKVDRKMLRQLGRELTVARLASLSTAAEYNSPATDAEVTLQTLWATVLGMDKAAISADNSFLRLGGDSITAIRLVRAAREAGFQLDVEHVFRHPVLHEMASSMRPLNLADEKTARPVPPFSLLVDPAGPVMAKVADQCGVDVGSVEDVYPCTAMQSGLMLLSAREPGTYVQQTIYRLSRPLPDFLAAWSALVALTPLLRTSIVEHDSHHLQVVLRDLPAVCIVEHIDEDFLETERQQLGTAKVLSRLAICKSPDGNTARAVFTIHHAVYDGWSQALLMERLQTLLKGRPVAPSPPFTNFIAHLQSTSASEAELFWRTQLANAEPVSFPELPSLGYRPQPMSVLNHDIASRRVLGSDFTESTRIRAAWALLVSRYLDQQQVTLGMTVNGRGSGSLAGIDQILGPMLTTVPVPVDTARTSLVSEYLMAVQQQAVEMQGHEQYGLQRIAALSDRMRAICDFHSLLVIHHKGPVPQDQAQLFWEPEPSPITRPFHAFALSMECTVKRDGVGVHATYDKDVINPRAMKRIVLQFEHILRQLSDARLLSSSVGDIELISPADRAEIATWNAIVPAPTMTCIHRLVEDQVKQRPDSPAVASWEGELTFRQLDALASSLAEHLRETANIGPKVLVPLVFEKSIYTVVTMLAVMKAGGACVALDPAHPTDRLLGILQDIEASVVLSSTSSLTKAQQLQLPVVTVNQALLDCLVVSSPRLPPSTVGPEDPAIILFTSGSTGKPKGIVIDHGAFSSSIRGHGETLRYRAGSRNLQFTAYTSDVSYGEMFTSLSRGACVCIPSDYERMNDLAGAMERLRVDWAFLTPSVASLLDPKTVPTLRTLVFGGETATPENIQTWADAVYLINSFGPAECSIWNCCNPGISTKDIGSNIGKGLGCAQWIVDPDDDSRLAPIGTVGELIVEGPNVAKGYLGLPEKTKAIFIQSRPWVPEERRAGSRLYKTGDLARFMPDGNVQFLGRRDAQVKLHGQRLELGEVEHQLRRYLPSCLTEVAAEMVRPAGGPPLLAAFANIRPVLIDEAVAEEDGDLAMSGAALNWLSEHFPGLEAALAERLPRFMIPSLLVPLIRMPLSGSAKTDRGRLRQIAQDMAGEQMARLQACRIVKHVAPANGREQRLQALWASVLDLSLNNIGRSDRFFHLGGNSIRAMRLVTLARAQGLGLSVKDIFDHPQLSVMAAAMHDLDPEANKPVRPFSLLPDAALEEGPAALQADAAQQCGVATDHVVDLYPCTPLQGGLMAQSLKQPGTYIGRFAYQMPAGIDMERFCNAWRTVVRQEALLRTRMVQSSIGLLQAVMSSEIEADWVVVQTVEEFAGQMTAMELGQPLVHFGVIETQGVFLLTLHHVLYDAWSLDLLFQKARTIYECHQIEEASTAFSHFIQHLQKQDLEAARAFWASQLAAAPVPSFPRLPSAHYSPSTDSLITFDVALPASLGSGILPSTIITASWAVVVGRQSDTFEDALFGVTYSGRSAPVAGIERIAGPTMATVPFRMPLDYDQRAESFLADVQRQATAVSAYEQYGLPQIRAVCEHAVAFQSLLVIQAAAPSSEEAWLRPVTPDDDYDDGQQAFHNFALSVECTVQGDGVRIVCNFDSHVLPERQARRVMGQFAHVLEQLACPSASLRLGGVQVISPADQAELEEWNDGMPEPDNRLVHQLVQETALVQPEALAVMSWDRNFTYAQLDNAAAALAGMLVTRGIKVGQRMPILFEKSSWAIVAMLAILKAGCVCVALDPAQSLDRLRIAVSQLQATLIMASDRHYSLVEDLVDGNDTNDVNNASDIDIIPVGPAHQRGWKAFPVAPACPTTPQDAAFVFLKPVGKHKNTSSSAAKETETIISHAAICSSIRGHGEALRFSRGPESRNLQFAAYTSTSSIGEIFSSLVLGACVCVPSDEESTHNLAGAIGRMQVDWAMLTPSVASILSPAAVPTLQTLVFGGGETPTQQNLQDWAGSVCLISSYGPAEWPGWTHCALDVSGDHDASNIGRQMKHCRTWITDPNNPVQLAPIGAVGELLIESPSAALSSHDNLNLDNGEEEGTCNNEVRFVVGPRWIHQTSEQRRVFFRTGRLARFRPDGTVQLQGRRDAQVKLHGQHVDIGEVEHRLRQELPALRKLAVEMVRPASAEAPLTLATFFNISSYLGIPAPMKQKTSSSSPSYSSAVAHSPAAYRAAAKLLEGLAARLALVLPAHMIPSIYVPLWAMPLSTSATVDREALKTLALELPAGEIASLTLATGRVVEAGDDVGAATRLSTTLERRSLWQKKSPRTRRSKKSKYYSIQWRGCKETPI